MSETLGQRSPGNKFFNPPGDKDKDFPKYGKLYAAIEAVGADERYLINTSSGPDEPVYFECFDASWVNTQDVNQVYRNRVDDFYRDIPLRVVELQDRGLIATYALTNAPPGEIVWFEMEYRIVDKVRANGLLYESLYADGVPVILSNIFAISREDINFANNGKNVLPEVKGSGNPRNFLDAIPSVDCSGVAIYDVGQGAFQAMLQGGPTAHPAIYIDFGGGVLGNKKTFPAELGHACFTAEPPIILSHWDWDHWSFAPRVPDALAAKWLAPPIPDKPVQKAFANKLKKTGSLFIWDVSPGTMFEKENIELGRCHGRTTNDSGIAVRITMFDNNNPKKCLLPGDADYQHLPVSFLVEPTWALVISHHGGKLKSNSFPTPSKDPLSVCSAGSGNTYKHPFLATFKNHMDTGWAWPISVGLCSPRPSHAIISPDTGLQIQLGRCHRHDGEKCQTSFQIKIPK